MNNKCYIVGAGDNSGTKFNKEINEYVIAADGGLAVLNKMGIKPNLIIGDFDSLGFVPKGDNVVCHKVEKDDTDMMLAVENALEKGYNNIEIYGGTGGRIDHTIANLQTMLYASRKGAAIRMIDSTNEYYVITSDKLILESRKEGDLSVFAIGGRTQNVNIKGAKYTAADMELTSDNPTAVSNSFIGNEVEISVGVGSLLIIVQKSSK